MKVKEESEKVGLKLNIQKSKIMASSPITSWQIDGETVETVSDFILGGSKITADGDCSHEIKIPAPWKKSYDQPRQHIIEQRHYFADRGPSSQSYGFSSSHVCACESWTIEKEGWVQKNWCFWTVVLEKALESPLDCKEINPINPKGNQLWTFTGRTDAEAPKLWPLDVKNCLSGKDPDDGKDWRQEEKGTIDDEMVGWHHWLDGHEFEQAPGVGDGQGSLVCCSPWGRKELDMTEWMSWTEVYKIEILPLRLQRKKSSPPSHKWENLGLQSVKDIDVFRPWAVTWRQT